MHLSIEASQIKKLREVNEDHYLSDEFENYSSLNVYLYSKVVSGNTDKNQSRLKYYSNLYS